MKSFLVSMCVTGFAILSMHCSQAKSIFSGSKASSESLAKQDGLYLADAVDQLAGSTSSTASSGTDLSVETGSSIETDLAMEDTTDTDLGVDISKSRLEKKAKMIFDIANVSYTGALTQSEFVSVMLQIRQKYTRRQDLISNTELERIQGRLGDQFIQFEGADQTLSFTELEALLKANAGAVMEFRKDKPWSHGWKYIIWHSEFLDFYHDFKHPNQKWLPGYFHGMGWVSGHWEGEGEGHHHGTETQTETEKCVRNIGVSCTKNNDCHPCDLVSSNGSGDVPAHAFLLHTAVQCVQGTCQRVGCPVSACSDLLQCADGSQPTCNMLNAQKPLCMCNVGATQCPNGVQTLCVSGFASGTAGCGCKPVQAHCPHGSKPVCTSGALGGGVKCKCE